MKGSMRFALLLVVLLLGGVVVNAWQYLGEIPVQRKQLKDFPHEVGVWEQRGADQAFDQQTITILGASDYLMRDYRGLGGITANFYVGYYASQRTGATYHSPQNCLPGSGWVMTDPGKITISPAGQAPFEANRYIVQNGSNKQLLVYWYQGRGRVVVSEYWGKVFTVLDSISMRRSDAAMVRITVPVTTSDEAALNAAKNFAAATAPTLPDFVPN